MASLSVSLVDAAVAAAEAPPPTARFRSDRNASPNRGRPRTGLSFSLSSWPSVDGGPDGDGLRVVRSDDSFPSPRLDGTDWSFAVVAVVATVAVVGGVGGTLSDTSLRPTSFRNEPPARPSNSLGGDKELESPCPSSDELSGLSFSSFTWSFLRSCDPVDANTESIVSSVLDVDLLSLCKAAACLLSRNSSVDEYEMEATDDKFGMVCGKTGRGGATGSICSPGGNLESKKDRRSGILESCNIRTLSSVLVSSDSLSSCCAAAVMKPLTFLKDVLISCMVGSNRMDRCRFLANPCCCC